VKRKPTRLDPLSILVLWLSAVDAITLRQLMSGVICFGETGGGKSTTFGAQARSGLLRTNAGFIVFTSKMGDTEDWIQACRREGREKDVRVFGPGHPHRFDAFQYLWEAKGTRGSTLTDNVLAAWDGLLEARNGGKSVQGSDPFWHLSVHDLASASITLLGTAGENISMGAIQRMISSAPESPDQVRSPEWQKESYVNALIDRSTSRKNLTPSQTTDLAAAIEYWLNQFPRLDPKTRSGVVCTFSSMSNAFCRGLLAELFSAGGEQLTPEDSFDGRIIIIDMPVKEFLDVGLFASVLWKLVWMRAAERRDRNRFPKPVVLWIDEAHNLVTRYDALFQATARSADIVSVYLTQNKDSLRERLGGTTGEAAIEALLANLATKVFLSNAHAATNAWAATLCGETWATRSNVTASLGGEGNTSSSTVEMKRHLIEPIEFMRLKKRGADGIAEGIVFRSGEPFRASGMNHLKVAFQAIDE
jgi:type IV secretory pathway TraG/TraD family ATPase VirD4